MWIVIWVINSFFLRKYSSGNIVCVLYVVGMTYCICWKFEKLSQMPLSSLFDLSSFDFSLWCILKCLLKSNKCNQCDFAFFRADNLTKYLKAHSGEKFKKCNQCDFPSFQAGNFRTLLKTQVEDQSIKVYSSKQPNLILLLLPRIHKYRTTVLFAPQL